MVTATVNFNLSQLRTLAGKWENLNWDGRRSLLKEAIRTLPENKQKAWSRMRWKDFYNRHRIIAQFVAKQLPS